MEIKKTLQLRTKLKRKKPTFRRQEWFRTVSLGEKWRSPKGIDSKLKIGEKARGKVPSVGYRSPRSVRGLDPKGFREVRIFNINDLKNLNSKTDVAVIGSTVGRKKRIEIIKKAEESGIKISNFNI